MNLILNSIGLLFNRLLNFVKSIKNNYILESPKYYYQGYEDLNSINLENELVITIDKFMEDNNLYQNGVIVSLSGGVDSMVIFSILIRLKQIKDFPLAVSSINYNLRSESKKESEFIKQYCVYYQIVYNIEHLSLTRENRSEFEEKSKDIRYDSYKKLIENFKYNGVILGHHMDDIIENIFTNSLNGKQLLDLEVMKIKGIQKDVNIYRPLLEFRKDVIYKFAHHYNIPYFKDTTPKWSRRGKMRNEIFPLLTNVFGVGWYRKLKEIGTQSNNWNSTVDNLIINPWLKQTHFGKYGFLMYIRHVDDLNLWLYFMPKLFFKIKYNTIRKNTIKQLLKRIEKSTDNVICLDSGFYCYKYNQQLIVYNLEDIGKNIISKKIISDISEENQIKYFLDATITHSNSSKQNNLPKAIINQLHL